MAAANTPAPAPSPAPPEYDVCIVGAGPHGLAALSSLLSPYATLSNKESTHVSRAEAERTRRRPRVCVVDPHGAFLHDFRHKFAALGIARLRSTTAAHPDLAEDHALAAFAFAHGRSSEMVDVTDSLAADAKMRSLWEVGAGDFDIPGTRLFLDFCADLVHTLPHTMLPATVRDIVGADGPADAPAWGGPGHQVLLDGEPSGLGSIRARHVVLALGASGGPNIPRALQPVLSSAGGLLLHTNDWRRLREPALFSGADMVVVVGGGLSAAQTALLAVRRGARRVVLCSRRPLVAREFDVPLAWLDRRRINRALHEFYGCPIEERLAMVNRIRGGGSIPKLYLRRLHAAQATGRLQLLVGRVQEAGVCEGGAATPTLELTVDLAEGRQLALRADHVVLGTGNRHDCMSLPLCRQLAAHTALPTCDGLPVLDDDLQWGDSGLSVVGALATLQIGPDAGNVSGARRAALVLASSLACAVRDDRDGAHAADAPGASTSCALLANPFALLDIGSDSDSESGSGAGSGAGSGRAGGDS